jgi:hypothetical protein
MSSLDFQNKVRSGSQEQYQADHAKLSTQSSAREIQYAMFSTQAVSFQAQPAKRAAQISTRKAQQANLNVRK